jgi:hypothetical protein
MAPGNEPARTLSRPFFPLSHTGPDQRFAIGTDNIRLWLALASHGDSLNGTFGSQVRDTAETLLLDVTGTFSAIPITV